MGYAFFGKFMATCAQIIEGFSLLAMAGSSGFLLAVLPLVLAIFLLHVKFPTKWEWLRYTLIAALFITSAVGIGLLMASGIGPMALLLVAGVFIGTLVSIVVFKMLVNAVLKFGQLFSDLWKVLKDIGKDNYFAAGCVVILFLIPLLGIVLLNALANAVLSSAGLSGVLPLVEAFFVGEIQGVLLLALMAGFSLVLGMRSMIDLVNRFLPSIVEAIKNSDFANLVDSYEFSGSRFIFTVVASVLFTLISPVVVLYGAAKGISHLAPVLFITAINLFEIGFGTKCTQTDDNTSEPYGVFARGLSILGGGIVGAVALVASVPAMPCYLIMRSMSFVFNAIVNAAKSMNKPATQPEEISTISISPADSSVGSSEASTRQNSPPPTPLEDSVSSKLKVALFAEPPCTSQMLDTLMTNTVDSAANVVSGIKAKLTAPTSTLAPTAS